jgi:hypothetical protein
VKRVLVYRGQDGLFEWMSLYGVESGRQLDPAHDPRQARGRYPLFEVVLADGSTASTHHGTMVEIATVRGSAGADRHCASLNAAAAVHES